MHLINKEDNSYVIAASVATLFTFALMVAVSNMVTTTSAAATTTITTSNTTTTSSSGSECRQNQSTKNGKQE